MGQGTVTKQVIIGEAKLAVRTDVLSRKKGLGSELLEFHMNLVAARILELDKGSVKVSNAVNRLMDNDTGIVQMVNDCALLGKEMNQRRWMLDFRGAMRKASERKQMISDLAERMDELIKQ